MNIIFLSAILALFVCAVNASSNIDGCKVPCMDGVFVLDVSKSIGKTKFNDMKDFTLSIINLMDVSPECSRAGLILFVENALIKFALNEHLTPTRLRDAIDQIKYEEHSSSGTNTPQALRLLRAGGKNGTLGLRDGKIHFAVFITDGKTYLGRNKPQNEMADQITKLAAYELHRARLYNQIYAIGIKTKNQKTISYIADPPSLAFSLAEFNQSLLNQVRINISKDLCDEDIPPSDDCDLISIIIICGAAVIGTLLLIVCITATVIIAPCRKKKKLGKKQSIHNGVTSIETSIQLPDVDKRQQCTCNTSEQSNHNHTKLKLHILASPNSLHNGKRSAQTRKKPTETGKKSVQTDSDSTQHGAATLRDVHVYDEVADSTDNVIELILTHPNDCDRVAKTSK